MSHRDLCRISLVALVSTTLSITCQNSVSAADKGKKVTAEDAAKDSQPAAAKANAPEATAATMPATAAAQAKLVPEKRDAIRRLMNVTRLPQVADKMYDMLLAQGQKSFELNLSRSIQEDSRYSEQQKNDLMQQVVASSGRMFSRYRELLPKEINLPDVLESISTQVYDKYFTAKELNDISDFYQTEAGKKALDVLPQVMQESAQMTGEVVTPKVKSIVAQIVMEERMRMESGLSNNAASGSPSPAKPEGGGEQKSAGQKTDPKK
ncbi:MAG: DUF2059 domain-containing protein [Candidatus Obscuribacterales bacterium]|nr:DUF2059 domain-containing protein [Candidatus Obscuribacterales bacterium]